jgi:hypothetical protein
MIDHIGQTSITTSKGHGALTRAADFEANTGNKGMK